MKNILTLLLVSILFILTNSQVSNIFVKSNRIFNLRNKNDKIVTIRKLEEDNTNDENNYSPENTDLDTYQEEDTNHTDTENIDPTTKLYNTGINVLKVCNYKYKEIQITFNIIFSFIH